MKKAKTKRILSNTSEDKVIQKFLKKLAHNTVRKGFLFVYLGTLMMMLTMNPISDYIKEVAQISETKAYSIQETTLENIALIDSYLKGEISPEFNVITPPRPLASDYTRGFVLGESDIVKSFKKTKINHIKNNQPKNETEALKPNLSNESKDESELTPTDSTSDVNVNAPASTQATSLIDNNSQ